MMDTPILDFVRRYSRQNALRLHMPGHKGQVFLGFEHLDITEFTGADSLYEADGIIRESEHNAGVLFGSETFYSTEGCSQCIRAMLYLTVQYAKQQGRKPLIAAGRNVHKTFLSAAALLDMDVMWLYPKKPESYLSCNLDAEDIKKVLSEAPEKPVAVYITSPDYLGNTVDVAKISAVCHRQGVLLLVDNAHGAYLRFLQPSRHPIDLGADLCCDSAHKTLPVLTGGAYLHIGSDAPELFSQQAKSGLALFGSTSPSYLILQSLDGANVYLNDGYREKLAVFLPKMEKLKKNLIAGGYDLSGAEPLKLTIRAKAYGYTGVELAKIIEQNNIVCEFYDPDFVVLMLTPEIWDFAISRLSQVLLSIPKRPAIKINPPEFSPCQKVMSVRQAMFSPTEKIPAAECAGRILADSSVGCPPAVPIAICGERMDEKTVACMQYYDMKMCTVVKEDGV